MYVSPPSLTGSLAAPILLTALSLVPPPSIPQDP